MQEEINITEEHDKRIYKDVKEARFNIFHNNYLSIFTMIIFSYGVITAPFVIYFFLLRFEERIVYEILKDSFFSLYYYIVLWKPAIILWGNTDFKK